MFCQFKNALGKPNEGVHSYRMFGIPIVDVFMTMLAAFVLAKVTNKTFISMFVFLLIVAFLLHWMFCVQTPVTTAVFGQIDKSDHYV